jgi:hypothetical protein
MAYVYRHIRLDKNEPFYIGIGSKENYARAYEKWKRNPIWHKITSKTEYEVDILIDDIDWETACKKEIEFIKLYGRSNNGSGTLCNLTDGGDGTVGRIMPKEAVEKLRQINIGRVFSEATREKMRQNRIGKKASEETKLRMSQAHKGKKVVMSEETRERWIALQKQRKMSPENKANLKKIKTGIKHSEETKAKMSKSRKGMPGPKKPVLCVTSGEVFHSVEEAALAFNVKPKTISRQIKGTSKNKYNLVYIK